MSDVATSGPIIVAGMHGSLVRRTGALLTELGLPLTGAFGAGADTGADILDVQRRMLAAASGSEEGWFQGVGGPRAEPSIVAGFERSASAAVSAAMSAGMRGWADPRSTLLLDWLDDWVGGSAYVLVYRPPWDVVASLEPAGVPTDIVLRTWTAWNETVLGFLDSHGDRCVLIEGGGIVNDPVSVIGAIEEGLGITLDTGGSTRNRAAWIWTAAARVADRRHVRRRAEIEPVHKLLDSLPIDARLLLGELDRRAAAVDTGALPPLVELVPERPDRPTRSAVVVTCHNDGQSLVDAVASVRCSRHDGVEAVVVDRASTSPQTVQVLDALEAVGVSVVRIHSSNGAEARNAGMAATVSPVLVFLEAPDLLRPDFVSEATARFDADGRLAVVQCDTRSGYGQGAADRGQRQGATTLRRPGDELWQAAAFRRDAVSDVGGFDAELGTPGLEQWDLELSLLRCGWQIAKLDVVGVDRRASYAIDAGIDLAPRSPNMARVIAKHRAFLASSPSASTELLEAADAVMARANEERDQAVAALVDTRTTLEQTMGLHQADLVSSNQRLIAAEARIAAMGREARMLEERLAEATDEVMRREQAAEAARGRVAEEHVLRLAERAEADRAREESARLAGEVSAIYATKLWRWSAGSRRVYGLLRRLSR